MEDNMELVSTLKRKLEFNEKQYRLLVENSHDVVTLFDMEGKYLYISQAVEGILGYTPEELVGKFVSDLFHQDDKQTILEINRQKLIKGKYFINPDFRMQKKDGTYAWIESHAIPVVDEEEKVIAVQSVNRDITQRKLIELQLLESEKRYRLISENSIDFISIQARDGTYTFVSPSVKEMLGYEPEELLGVSGFDFVHPADLSALLDSQAHMKPGGISSKPYQFRIRKKDQTYIWIEARTKPIAYQNEQITQTQTSARDITARKIVEEKLEKSEKINRLISTNSKDLISLYEIGENPKRVFISASCKEIMGYEQDEMIGRSPFDFMVEEDAKRMRLHIHPVTLSGGVSTAEYRARKKDGTIIWLETISNPFFDTNGKMSGFQTSARDVTQRKIWEQETQKAKENAELATARLEELLNEKSDLMALFSHDMRAPLNQIKGLAQIMELSMDDKDVLLDCINKLNHAANQQLSLYRDIISMLKSDQMKLDQRLFKKLPLIMLVGKGYKNLEVEFIKKQVSIDVSGISKEIELTIQLDLFIQAIQNLLSNALKFSFSGGTVFVAAFQNESSTSITITDQGIGFDPSIAESIFNRFTKEGREGTNNEASTGLGLYLVKKIIENHQGKITAHSEGEWKGSSFVILIPNAYAEQNTVHL